ncbi:MAG: B12-binding domain-containing radical SAM protein [Oscillospiraceae bacterium]|nr:B12-binding domain-containing radical SAM protein [Oscillospiraceae bacterium]
MNKIVLLAINAKYVHSSLSVWVIAAGIAKYAKMPHEVEIIEATIHQSNSEIAGLVAAHAPDVIGISAYIWNATKLPETLKLLRNLLPEATIVLGGPEASHNKYYWLKHGADRILSGEGEHEFPAFLNKADLQENRPPVCVNPYTEAYLEALDGRLAYIETSRGCPFKCTFCLSAGSAVHYFPIDTVKEQLSKLAQSGARTVKLVDRTFNCNASRAYELFEYIIGLDTKNCFHFEVAADLFDARSLALLQTAPPGRIQLEAGLQSFFEPALRASTRLMDLDRAERNILALLSCGNIHIHVDLIAGLPYETLGDFKDSFDRTYSLRAHTLQLGFLKLLHGSALRKQAPQLGIDFMREAPYEITSSPWLTPDDILTLKATENAIQHTCNKSRFLTTLEYVLATSGLRPFALFKTIGSAAPNHGTDLTAYAEQLLECFAKLPGIDETILIDHMVYDWLCMVKGQNMPKRLKNFGNQRDSTAIEFAEKRLGRKIRRDEAAVLSTGAYLYVDSEDRSRVTSLYKVHVANL